MATMFIRDDALWARHIEGDPEIARRIRAMVPEESIVLKIDGRPLRFLRMRDGKGRPTEGLQVDPSSLAEWRALQSRRGSMVTVELDGSPTVDPYLLSLSMTLAEWNSPGDASAYDGL